MAAVETTAERKPRRLKLTVVKGIRKKEIEALAKRDLAAGSNGLSCWTAVTAAGCDQFPMVTGTGPQAARWAPFKCVDTTLGNIKTARAGAYHRVSAKHAQRYLAGFAWRFNRRYQLDRLTERLAYACAQTAPHPYRVSTRDSAGSVAPAAADDRSWEGLSGGSIRAATARLGRDCRAH